MYLYSYFFALIAFSQGDTFYGSNYPDSFHESYEVVAYYNYDDSLYVLKNAKETTCLRCVNEYLYNQLYPRYVNYSHDRFRFIFRTDSLIYITYSHENYKLNRDSVFCFNPYKYNINGKLQDRNKNMGYKLLPFFATSCNTNILLVPSTMDHYILFKEEDYYLENGSIYYYQKAKRGHNFFLKEKVERWYKYNNDSYTLIKEIIKK